MGSLRDAFVGVPSLGPPSRRAGGANQELLWLAFAGRDDAGWKRVLKSEDDAFPGVNPRPVAPDMILRNWSVPTTTATHVRFVVRDNQCTGQASYHGDQDNDPLNNSDCRVGDPGTPYPPRNTEVHAAELQVWSSKPEVDGANVDR